MDSTYHYEINTDDRDKWLVYSIDPEEPDNPQWVADVDTERLAQILVNSLEDPGEQSTVVVVVRGGVVESVLSNNHNANAVIVDFDTDEISELVDREDYMDEIYSTGKYEEIS